MLRMVLLMALEGEHEGGGEVVIEHEGYGEGEEMTGDEGNDEGEGGECEMRRSASKKLIYSSVHKVGRHVFYGL